MTQEHLPDHQKISFTAKLVALVRSSTTIPFARDVSELVGAEALGRELERNLESYQASTPVLAAFLEARYKSLVSAVKRSRARQVVEFAGGVSLRGLAMASQDPDLVYVDTDLPDLTAEKRELVHEISARHKQATPSNYHVAVANILSREEIDAALAPLDPSEHVVVLNEGLLPYLSHAEKRQAASNVARILGKYGGVWITPDLSPFSSLASLSADRVGTSREESLRLIEERTGRDLAAHSFATEQEARQFFEHLGFEVDERPQIDGSYELSALTTPRDSDLLEKLRHELKLWELRLAPRGSEHFNTNRP